MIRRVNKIKFGILGDADILNLSVVSVTKTVLTEEPGSVYDPCMGCASNESICATCNEGILKCPGHFGHVDLNVPVIIHYKPVVSLLKCFCFEPHCHRLICSADELRLNNVSGYKQIVNFIGKQSTCFHCGARHPVIKLNISDNIITAVQQVGKQKVSLEITPIAVKVIFDDIIDDDAKLLGINIDMFHPRNLVLTKFLVLPICCRPRMVVANNVSDDDLTLMIVDIVKNNNVIANYIASKSNCESTIDDEPKRKAYVTAVNNIKLRTSAYVDNRKGKVVHNTNHKPMTGINERLKSKNGLVRQHLEGKRLSDTGRSVLGPDSTMAVNQVVVPRKIAESLIITEWVNEINLRKMQKLVDDGQVATIIRGGNESVKICVKSAKIKRGTILQHGDEIIDTRTGRQFIVTDCKIPVLDSFIIRRNGQSVPTICAESRPVIVNVGDRIDRCLRNGDFVMLNRQPTLHRNSIQGMEIVVKEGKTIRLNLSITGGFNADFDGDEGNIFVMNSVEARAELEILVNANNHTLSAQSSKADIYVVQDTLLACYLMTRRPIPSMSRAQFFDCLFRTSAFDRYPDIDKRLRFAAETRYRWSGKPQPLGYYACHLFAFILPPDFDGVDWQSGLRIVDGVIVAGHLDKSTMKSGRDSIIRLLSIEYGKLIACKFIDDVQFLTNAWLEFNACSIGIGDCLIDPSYRRVIDENIDKYFHEADLMANSTDNEQIRESRIKCSLNKAKDTGSAIARDLMNSDNNLLKMVYSGAKGDLFNVTQITGLLGQQFHSGERLKQKLNDGTRSSIHEPYVITDSRQWYESRGFIVDSFVYGLRERAMFQHAESGREGMIHKAMKTADSGYIQRQQVKLMEDVKIAYDGTVRDANNNIFQYVYGNHGYDPSLVYKFIDNVIAVPIDIVRLANRLNKKYPSFPTKWRRSLTVDEINAICSKCAWNKQIPSEAYESVWNRHEAELRRQLTLIAIDDRCIDELVDIVVTKYHTTRITPGDNIGILAAQSIGEKQTQTNLNTFHTAGKLQENKVGRFEEILSMSKNLKTKMCVLKFRRRYEDANDLRRDLARYPIVGIRLNDLIERIEPVERSTQRRRLILNRKVMYENMMTSIDVAEAIDKIINNVDDNLKKNTASSSFTTCCEYVIADSDNSVIVKYVGTVPAMDNFSSTAATASLIIDDVDDDVDDDVNDDDDGNLEISMDIDVVEEEEDEKDDDEDARSLRSVSSAVATAITDDIIQSYGKKLIRGIAEISAIHYDWTDEDGWYAVTEGSSYKKLLTHPLIDARKLYTNDFWQVYDTCGIVALREYLVRDLTHLIEDIHPCHVRVIADRLTLNGYPTSITRYTMRDSDAGPLSKAAFEECGDNLINAALKTQTEYQKGVSAAIICGTLMKCGTGAFDLKADIDKFMIAAADDMMMETDDDL